MRLTADVLTRALSYVNTLKERELSLRGLKIPAIENLAVLMDQFDLMDFTDNEIRKLENFPKLHRLTSLLVISNAITSVSATIGEQLTHLTDLILTNNQISSFAAVYHIASLKNTLEVLSLLDNPITMKEEYRKVVILKMGPQLKMLDFVKVSRKEREAAAVWAETEDGRRVMTAAAMEAALASSSATQVQKKVVYSENEKNQIKLAIESAATAIDVDSIEKQLKAGTFKFSTAVASS